MVLSVSEEEEVDGNESYVCLRYGEIEVMVSNSRGDKSIEEVGRVAYDNLRKLVKLAQSSMKVVKVEC